MAKSGGGVNQLLLEKGEKIGLGIAAGAGALFLALGIMSVTNRPQDPETFAKAMDQKGADLTRIMAGKEATIDPVKKELEEPANKTPVVPVAVANPWFDPTPQPDWRRTAPVVLGATEGQADVVAMKILANDIVLERNSETGEVTRVRVGVVTAKDPSAKSEGAEKFVNDLARKFKGKMPGKKRNRPIGGFPGGPGFGEGEGPGGGGFPGGPGGGGFPGEPGGGGFRGGPGGGGFPGGPGGGGFPGGPGGGGFPGGPGGGGFPGGPGGGGFPGGPGGGGYPGGPGGSGFGGGAGKFGGSGGMLGGFPGEGGGYGGVQSAGQRFEVQYIEGENDEEIEKQLNGRRLAITISPQRMTVLQASFPYRQQLDRFAVAMRYKEGWKELFAHPDDVPVFHGVDVQRRACRPNGMPLEDWQSIDLAGNTQELRAVALTYKEEPVDLKRVMLHEDHMLVMPLPEEVPGASKYPEMNLKTLKESIEKMKKQDAKASNLPAPKSKYMGGGNPFKRETHANANFYNFGGEGEAGGMFRPPSGLMAKPKSPTEPAGPSQPPTSYEPPDHIYVRVYDTDIKDGLEYQYRMRVKLKNPNFGKKDQVSKASDAENEELPALDEHWYEFPQRVKVPQTVYHYVVEPTPAKPKESQALAAPSPEKGQAVIQFQRWYGQLDLNEKLKEPVGDWVIAELLATRGMYVSGKAFSPVPFWSSVENAFVLREITGDPKPAKGKEPRRGAIIEPVRPRTLLAVEVSGGKVKARMQPNPGERTNRGGLVEDDCASEVLFMYPDGSLELRSSATDKADADRKEREEHFRKWVTETEQRGLGGPGTTAPKGKEDF